MTPPPIARLNATDLSTLEQEALLHPDERAKLVCFPAEKRRQDWLLGRIVGKRAVREAQARAGRTPSGWADLAIDSSPGGAPRARTSPGEDELALSLSHGHGRAAAWACPPGREGGLPGVDLEQVKPRRLGTLRFYLHPEEREGVLSQPGWDEDPPPKNGDPTPRDLAAIVCWSLKEAAFKALQPPRGTGLLDVSLALVTPFDAARGAARVTYVGKALERARALGVTSIEAGWEREGDFVLAWVLARGGALPAP